AGPQHILKPALPLKDRTFVHPSLAEQSGENQGTEREGNDGGLRGQDAFLDRQPVVAKQPDAEYCRAHDRNRAHEDRDRHEGRANATADPYEQRAARGERPSQRRGGQREATASSNVQGAPGSRASRMQIVATIASARAPSAISRFGGASRREEAIPIASGATAIVPTISEANQWLHTAAGDTTSE